MVVLAVSVSTWCVRCSANATRFAPGRLGTSAGRRRQRSNRAEATFYSTFNRMIASAPARPHGPRRVVATGRGGRSPARLAAAVARRAPPVARRHWRGVRPVAQPVARAVDTRRTAAVALHRQLDADEPRTAAVGARRAAVLQAWAPQPRIPPTQRLIDELGEPMTLVVGELYVGHWPSEPTPADRSEPGRDDASGAGRGGCGRGRTRRRCVAASGRGRRSGRGTGCVRAPRGGCRRRADHRLRAPPWSRWVWTAWPR